MVHCFVYSVSVCPMTDIWLMRIKFQLINFGTRQLPSRLAKLPRYPEGNFHPLSPCLTSVWRKLWPDRHISWKPSAGTRVLHRIARGGGEGSGKERCVCNSRTIDRTHTGRTIVNFRDRYLDNEQNISCAKGEGQRPSVENCEIPCTYANWGGKHRRRKTLEWGTESSRDDACKNEKSRARCMLRKCLTR